jgi:hypothetical protein
LKCKLKWRDDLSTIDLIMSLANTISAHKRKRERRRVEHSQNASNDRSPSDDVLDRKAGRICRERLAAGKFFARTF